MPNGAGELLDKPDTKWLERHEEDIDDTVLSLFNSLLAKEQEHSSFSGWLYSIPSVQKAISAMEESGIDTQRWLNPDIAYIITCGEWQRLTRSEIKYRSVQYFLDSLLNKDGPDEFKGNLPRPGRVFRENEEYLLRLKSIDPDRFEDKLKEDTVKILNDMAQRLTTEKAKARSNDLIAMLESDVVPNLDFTDFKWDYFVKPWERSVAKEFNYGSNSGNCFNLTQRGESLLLSFLLPQDSNLLIYRKQSNIGSISLVASKEAVMVVDDVSTSVPKAPELVKHGVFYDALEQILDDYAGYAGFKQVMVHNSSSFGSQNLLKSVTKTQGRTHVRLPSFWDTLITTIKGIKGYFQDRKQATPTLYLVTN